jgi:hypothetical protein
MAAAAAREVGDLARRSSLHARRVKRRAACGVSKLAFRLQNGDFAHRNRVLTPHGGPTTRAARRRRPGRSNCGSRARARLVDLRRALVDDRGTRVAEVALDAVQLPPKVRQPPTVKPRSRRDFVKPRASGESSSARLWSAGRGVEGADPTRYGDQRGSRRLPISSKSATAWLIFGSREPPPPQP